ncbi:MAG: N-acetyl-alpha-D-glucosaminyl-diphospho-ditrans,octacis-undecaprenol 4-epimerase [Chlamydiae bacterium]|nr:N-acetyl-alpha-D-glucosaminyl-diphospho-ditrans,octacis-undecaprenol 4-epimerase [Chlamydiota bacterium]
MDKKKPLLLITGMCGRIGCEVAAMFSQDFHVVGLDICTPPVPYEGVDYFFTDVSSLENVKDSLRQVREKYGSHIASFIHLAAYYNFEGGKWEKYQKITIEGTANLLEALKDFELDQFVFSSTLLVYAPCRLGEKIDENSLVDPKWEYPLSKIKTEEIIKANRGNASSVILRIAGIYDDGCHSIPISQHIARIYEKKLESHFFPGNVDQGATFLHMDDLMRALKIIVEKRKELKPEELFVLGEGEVLNFGQLQDEIGRLLHGKTWWTMRIPKWVAKCGAAVKKSFIKPWMVDLADDHYEVDTQKARAVLGWEPTHSLKNCLSKMVDALKQNPKKWYQEHEI